MPGVPAVARAAQAVRARSWNWGRRGVGIVTVLLATFALAAVPLAEAMPSGARAEASVPAPPTIPDVGCAPGDSPETGLQGQVPVADRAAGFKGFSCNLKLLGQFPGPGGTWVGSWAGSCAYNATKGNGVIVIDASDPAHPRATATLTSPAMMHTWESLKYNPRRQLLAATSFDDQYFDVYDVSDCRHPQLRASIALGSEAHGHAGNFTPDGLTYYSSQMFRGLGGIMPVIDVSDPSDPQHLLDWQFSGNGRPHDISFNEDGTRAYAMQPGQFESTTFPGPNGLVILDVSDIQFRRPNPQINVISTLFWEDSGQAQQSLPVTFHGRPYLITTDELGAGGVEGRQGACARGLSPFGFARIIDISNELNPKIVSKLELQTNNPANCPFDTNDDAPDTRIFGYDSHYCNVNRLNNPTMLGCAYFESGLRIFDIRNPRHPKEIAYYNPPPRPGTTSEHAAFAPTGSKQTDWASSPPRFVGCQVWDQFQDNGYLFLQFTHGPALRLCKQAGGNDDLR